MSKTYKITGEHADRIAKRDGCTIANGEINVKPTGWYCGPGDVRPLCEGFDVDDYFRSGRYLGPDVNGVEPCWSHAPVLEFEYATDGESGVIAAESLAEAYRIVRSGITDAQVEDGATLWVEDATTGERMTMGKNGVR